MIKSLGGILSSVLSFYGLILAFLMPILFHKDLTNRILQIQKKEDHNITD